MSQVITDQADGLRRLMLKSRGRLVAVVGSGPAVGATSITQNLVAALVQQGKDVLLLDEHGGTQTAPARRDGRLVLIDAVLDQEGALSPLAAQADNVLVVLQPNAASITQAYACIKRLHHAHALQRLRVLLNFATDAAEAQRILANLAHTGSRYLALTLEPAGCVRSDPHLPLAQRQNASVVEAFQASPAAIDIRQMATDLPHWPWCPPGSRAPSAPAGTTASREAHGVLERH